MQAVANNVAYSVQIATAPNSTPDVRQQASKFCNDYIHNTLPNDLCEVGFLLTTHSEPAVVLAGLQFIEHVAKYKWQVVPDREQVKLKLLSLMQTGMTSDSERCPSFLQEALARVIVEIAKREWPQLWPNLFPRLFEIANSSDLALLVLRRMVEDVGTLQTIDCQERRRELNQSLTAICPDVIKTFFRVLIESVKQFQITSAQVHQRRAKVCLGCLLPCIEWAHSSSFAKDNMIPTLFALLPDFYFQMNAAECILQLVERKPAKKEDRFDIPRLCLADESFSYFLQATSCAQPNNSDFLRKLGDIMIGLSPNVVIGKVKVENFLRGCETLAMREEAVSVLGSTSATNHFLKTLEKDVLAIAAQHQPANLPFALEIDKCLTRLLGLILQKLVTAPPKSLEREEMNRLKNEFSTLLRTVGRRVPSLYSEVNGWLRNSLNSPNSVQNFQWEALTLVVDAVSSSVSKDDAEMIKVGLMDLETCHSKFYSEESLELKSLILSLVSALFVFLSLAKKRGEFSDAHHRMMISIFDSMFKCFYYEDSSNTKEIRRHSSALFIKLAIKYPDVMALGFDFLHSSASAVASKLSTMEYCNVLESLMQISNVWNDYAKQTTFLGTFFNASEWQQVSIIAENPQSFASIFPEAVFLEKRALLMRTLGTANGSLSRVKKITKHSTTVLQSQNSRNTDIPFAIPNGISAEDAVAHPAYDHICPMLPVILKLVKTIHCLIENPDFAYIQDLNEGERVSVLGLQYSECNTGAVSDSEKDKTHKEKIKTFVLVLQELSCNILGESCRAFGSRFYLLPQLSNAYLSFVGHNSQILNDFRLRSIVRNVFKPFLLSCPVSQAGNVIIPFAQKFFPFMMERLLQRWTVIENSKLVDADGEEEKEVLENSSLRLLTKEYIELLERMLEKHSSDTTSRASNSECNAVDMDMDNDIECSASGGQSQGGSEIGEVGIILLSDPVCFNAIVNCIVSCICWDDSAACRKASRCILLMWDRIVPQVEVVKGTFATILRAVCVWVESESNLDTLLRILDTCFRSYYNSDPQFIQLLKEWGAPESDIQKLVSLCQVPKSEKKRKDLLRKMIQNNPALEINKSPKSQWLRGLPQLKISTDKVGSQRPPEIDLAECFSLIHN